MKNHKTVEHDERSDSSVERTVKPMLETTDWVWFMAWLLATVAWILSDYWWLSERHQWAESETKYQQELQSLKLQLQESQPSRSAREADGLAPMIPHAKPLPHLSLCVALRLTLVEQLRRGDMSLMLRIRKLVL
jgi:hypothetical protein